MRAKRHRLTDSARSFLDAYTHGLTREDLQRLFTRDTREAYRFFARNFDERKLAGLRRHKLWFARAKLFFHGRSQAVRLPKEFRFEGTEVFVRRVGADVVLSSQAKAPMQNLLTALDEFEPGFIMERSQPVCQDDREALFSAAKG